MELTDSQESWLSEMARQFKTAGRNPNSPPIIVNVCSAVRYLPNDMKTKALCLAAVLNDYNALDFVPDALKTQVKCLAEVIRPVISSWSGGSRYGINLINSK